MQRYVVLIAVLLIVAVSLPACHHFADVTIHIDEHLELRNDVGTLVAEIEVRVGYRVRWVNEADCIAVVNFGLAGEDLFDTETFRLNPGESTTLRVYSTSHTAGTPANEYPFQVICSDGSGGVAGPKVVVDD